MTTNNSQKSLNSVMSIVPSCDVFTRYLDTELRKHGSSLIRFRIMNALVLHGGMMTPIEIARSVFRAKHTITPILRILEREGEIQRRGNPKDGRSVIIYITEKGWEFSKKMTPIAFELSQRALSCLDDEQTLMLRDIAKQLRQHLLKQNAADHLMGAGSTTKDKVI